MDYSFEELARYVIDKIEGGYVDDKNDPGGETKYGLSKKSYPNLDIKSLTKDDAIKIYKIDYWDKIKCDLMGDALAAHVFDSSINCGVKSTIKMLQRAVCVKDDGIFGSITKNAVYNANELISLMSFINERYKYYRSLKLYHIYGKGWENRINLISVFLSRYV